MDNINKNRQELIDRFLLGEMTESERTVFEKQLSEDEDLRQDVDICRNVVTAFQYDAEQKAFDAMKSMSEDEFKTLISGSETKTTKNKYISFVRLSAAIAAVALILIYIGLRPKYSSEQLFALHYATQAYETYPTRGGSELSIEEKVLIQQAKKLYIEKEYTLALSIYNQYFASKQDWKIQPEEIILYSAICQLETEDLSKATEKLSYLASSEKFEFQEEALWNLSFAYLKNNQRDKAKKCLNQLVEKEGDHTDKASKLIEELNKKRWF